MGRDDLYRRTTWTPEDQEQFFARLARSRSLGNKSQYARIQGYTLFEAGLFESAIELFNRVLSEWPSPTELAQTHLHLAQCHAELDHRDDAATHFRAALAAEKAMPNIQTGAWLLYPWFVLSNEITERYDEIERVICDHEEVRERHFPNEVYRWAAAKALLAERRGDFSAAVHFAKTALAAADQTDSGFRYHPDVGLVKNPAGTIYERLLALAADR